MSNQSLEVVGAWVAAVGTVIAALGVTPAITDGAGFLNQGVFSDGEGTEEQIERSKIRSENLSFIGNTFQGIGNALEAAGEPVFNLEKAGEELQTAGNTTILYSIDSNFSEEKKTKLDITGNLLQAFGGVLAAIEELQEFQDDLYLDVIGNSLQAVGNSLQAVGGMFELEDKKEIGKAIIFSGSWIQSGGAIISAVATMREVNKSRQEEANKDDEEKKKIST